MRETFQDHDLLYVHDSDTELISLSIVSGCDLEKIKIEWCYTEYEPDILDSIATSLRKIADTIRMNTEVLEFAPETEEDEDDE